MNKIVVRGRIKKKYQKTTKTQNNNYIIETYLSEYAGKDKEGRNKYYTHRIVAFNSVADGMNCVNDGEFISVEGRLVYDLILVGGKKKKYPKIIVNSFTHVNENDEEKKEDEDFSKIF